VFRSCGRPVYHDRPPRIGPMVLWSTSRSLYRHGFFRLAKVMKGISFVLFKAVLPPEAVVGRGVRLEHYGLGVVIHPNTVIGNGCRIYHAVTLGSSASIGSDDRIIIGSEVLIGAGATIINHSGRTLRIGDRCRIGANSVIVNDVPADTVVRAPVAVWTSKKADS
jgi:serine O-acetyltransferase